MTFRKIVFWLHFGVGVTVGSVIAVMAATGMTLAFREQILARAEAAVRHVTSPQPASRLKMSEILAAVLEERPDARPMAITVVNDPAAATQVTLGKSDVVFVNPYTGEVRISNQAQRRAFFDTMERVHRWLGLQGQARQVGLTITSAACAGFFVLLLSGLFLWWPRTWTGRGFGQALRIRFDRHGKARDWNWHTTLGFWLAPVILLSTGTGLIMAYPKMADLLYPLPPRPEPAAAPPSAAGARPLAQDALLAKVQAAYPNWETINLRLSTGRRPAPGAKTGALSTPAAAMALRSGEANPRRAASGRTPVLVSVKNRGTWPQWQIQLTLDPYDGHVLKVEDPSAYSGLRRLRTSARSIHVGEAGGAAGQTLVLIGAVGALVLIVTGFSLAIRRLWGGT